MEASFTKNGEFKVSAGIAAFAGPIKVQDDDDGLWRYLRSRTLQGQPVLYLAQPGDSTPGTVARVQDDDDGVWRVLKSRTLQGQQLLYLVEP